jgi:hypothetical protein
MLRIFAERDVLAGLLQPLAQQRGLGIRVESALRPVGALANSLRICAWRIGRHRVAVTLLDAVPAALHALARTGR